MCHWIYTIDHIMERWYDTLLFLWKQNSSVSCTVKDITEVHCRNIKYSDFVVKTEAQWKNY